MATAAAAMSITSRAPTSPASRRSPTRCWPSGWFEAASQLWKTRLWASTSRPVRPNLRRVSDFDDPFEVVRPPAQAERLTLDLDGWEGPLDLLLTLARTQKVALAKISILALVEQYLAFIADAKKLRLEIAADYLVMAAWLAYLKSCLLLPKDGEDDPSPEELAMRLQLRLQRLSAMREAGARLLARDRIGRDVLARAAPRGAEGARPARPRRLRARRAGRAEGDPPVPVAGGALRSDRRLRRGAGADRAGL